MICLLRVSSDNRLSLMRAAYHLGNRHTPVQVSADALQLEADPVLEDMLVRLGVTVAHVEAPFEPEAGAYGGGHRHGHDATFEEDYAAAQALFQEHHGHDHGHDHHHHHGGMKHYHDEDMQSLSLNTDKPLNPDKFFPWVQKLVAEDGPSILRCKGILNFKDDPDRFVFQGVHMILDGDHQRPWKDGEKRDSRLVFIGRKLPEDKIRTGFESCIA